MKDRYKIAIACFVGGFICAITSLIVAPKFWMLGLLAGFCAGYLAYEFKTVLLSIPVAFNETKKFFSGTFGDLITWWQDLPDFKDWFKKTNPFLSVSIIVAVPLWPFTIQFLGTPGEIKNDSDFIIVLGSIIFYFLALGISAIVIWLLTDLGKLSKDYIFKDFLLNEKKTKLDYPNFFRFFIKGLLRVIIYPLAYLTLGPFFMVGLGAQFIGIFVRFLFKKIHSHKRLLCAVDGTIGGGIAYWFFHDPALSLGGAIMVAMFGGLLGAVIGILNWELISVRIFKFHLAENKV